MDKEAKASPEKPVDEKELEASAREAIKRSRVQIHRAKNILQAEVNRLDLLLLRGK